MEQIITNNGQVTWNVISTTKRQEGRNKTIYFKVACAVCGYQKNNRKYDIQRQVSCPGCSKKPAALKTDLQGACMTICEIGMVEFVRDYQEKYETSEREAVRHFVEVVKAHLSTDDPVQDSQTEESARASVRRATGKKKDEGECTGLSAPNNKPEKTKRFRVSASPESVQEFLDKHLPGYEVVHVSAERAYE